MTDSEGNEIGKLFVGGLSQSTTSDSLKEYFSKNFGPVEDAVVMMDNLTGRSRGFGYVKYTDPEIVNTILRSKPHFIDGKEIDAKQCNIYMKGKNRRSLKVFVGGIAMDQDAETLKVFFEQYGKVTDVNLMMDSSKQRHRGFAFVGFEDENVVKKVIALHFVVINGKQVEIKEMEPPNYEKKLNLMEQNLSNNPNMYYTRYCDGMIIADGQMSVPKQPQIYSAPMPYSPPVQQTWALWQPCSWGSNSEPYGQWTYVQHQNPCYQPTPAATPAVWTQAHTWPSQPQYISPATPQCNTHMSHPIQWSVSAQNTTENGHVRIPTQSSPKLMQSSLVTPTTWLPNAKLQGGDSNVAGSSALLANRASSPDYCSWLYGTKDFKVIPVNLENGTQSPPGGSGDYSPPNDMTSNDHHMCNSLRR